MPNKKLILDSWPIIALIKGEPVADQVRDVLEVAKLGKVTVFASVINISEVYYKFIRETDQDRARNILTNLNKSIITIEPATDQRVIHMAEIKAHYSLSICDCFAVQLALEKKASILTGDPEFKKVEGLVAIEWLSKV